MDTLISMRVFREVVEAGSFVAAAERCALSTAMASKHVAHLERQLRTRLLNRTSRHLSLTEAGTVYYEQCCEALDMLQAAEASISHGNDTPRGTLKVTAPVWCANRFIAGALAAYHQTYPQVVVDLRLENRRVDLAAEGYDLALRATGEPSPALIVRPLCTVRLSLVATPAYLDRVGRATPGAALPDYAAILPSYVDLRSAVLTGPQGKQTARLTAAMKLDNTTLAYHCVLTDMGVAYLPDWLAADDLAAGRLEEVLPGFTLPRTTLFAAYTSRKYLTSKVRTFIDFMSERLGGNGGILGEL